MRVNNKSLYEAIKELSVMDEKVLLELYERAGEKDGQLSKLLRAGDYLADKNLGMLEADVVSMSYVSLAEQEIAQDVLTILPYQVAKTQMAVVWNRGETGIKIAINDIENDSLIENLQKKTGEKVAVYYATERDIEMTINRYEMSVEGDIEELVRIAEGSEDEDEGGESPIIRLVKMILTYAESNRTSDVHIEPGENKSVIRFRIDGVLHDIVKIPTGLHSRVVTRIKVMAKLRTDEHQAAQDGKLVIKIDDQNLDVRVSVVPVTDGEKVVMRLLSAKSRQFALADLGMLEKDRKKVESAYKAAHGMLLSTGPTGSGKTTTLYGILKKLNKSDVNIMTIENPVEYDLERVNQIQVNTKTELTFAAGLRSIVRQDPDIILVGEIRDSETAGIAINSAMTGHLVLSTLHANDAATTMPRLIDLGVEPFLVASTVNVVVAQRLVRKICPNCRVSRDITKTELSKQLSSKEIAKLFGKSEKIRVYKGEGCVVCHDSGYKDRIGIFEVMVVSDKLREAIVAERDASEISKIAVSEGMTTMLEDGLAKVKSGVTTVEEVLRVTRE